MFTKEAFIIINKLLIGQMRLNSLLISNLQHLFMDLIDQKLSKKNANLESRKKLQGDFPAETCQQIL